MFFGEVNINEVKGVRKNSGRCFVVFAYHMRNRCEFVYVQSTNTQFINLFFFFGWGGL